MKILVAENSNYIRNSISKLIKKLSDSYSQVDTCTIKELTKKNIETRPNIIIIGLNVNELISLDSLTELTPFESKPIIILLVDYLIEKKTLEKFINIADYVIDKNKEIESLIDIISHVKNNQTKSRELS